MRLSPFIKENRTALAVFGLAAATTLWFGFSFLANLIYFNDPRHQDEALKPWMTPRYVVMSYKLPRKVVADTLNLPEGGPRGMKLGDIADNLGLTMEELTARVREAALAHRDSQE